MSADSFHCGEKHGESMTFEALENPQEGAFWSEFFVEWRAVGGRYVAPQRTVERTVKGRKAA